MLVAEDGIAHAALESHSTKKIAAGKAAMQKGWERKRRRWISRPRPFGTGRIRPVRNGGKTATRAGSIAFFAVVVAVGTKGASAVVVMCCHVR